MFNYLNLIFLTVHQNGKIWPAKRLCIFVHISWCYNKRVVIISINAITKTRVSTVQQIPRVSTIQHEYLTHNTSIYRTTRVSTIQHEYLPHYTSIYRTTWVSTTSIYHTTRVSTTLHCTSIYRTTRVSTTSIYHTTRVSTTLHEYLPYNMNIYHTTRVSTTLHEYLPYNTSIYRTTRIFVNCFRIQWTKLINCGNKYYWRAYKITNNEPGVSNSSLSSLVGQ